MRAILVKTLKHGNKTICGEVLTRGMGTITLLVNENNGNRSMKTFKEENYAVKCY